MKKSVYNKNFQKPTAENLSKHHHQVGTESDYHFSYGSHEHPQITFNSHLVPAPQTQQAELPYIEYVAPQLEGFLGNDFFYSASGVSFLIGYNELVSNATNVSNYQLSGVGATGMSILRIEDHSVEDKTNVRVYVSGQPSEGEFVLTVGGSVQDADGNVMVSEAINWWVDLTYPIVDQTWLNDTFGGTIDPNTWDWNVYVDFSEWVSGWDADPASSVWEAYFEETATGKRYYVDVQPEIMANVAPSFGPDAGIVQIVLRVTPPADISILQATDEFCVGVKYGADELIKDRAENALQGAYPTKFTVQYQSGVTQPSAPTINDVAVSGTSATMYFTAPSSNGGSPIIGYDYWTANSGWEPISGGGSITSWSFTVPYDSETIYKIRARNADFDGMESDPYTVYGEVTVSRPDAPTASIVEGDGALTVTYELGNDNGSAITSVEYLVTDSIDDLSGSFTTVGDNPFTISGLTNGQGYYVYLRAVNGVGYGESWSGWGNPTGLPGVPTLNEGVALDGAISISLTENPDDGGSATVGFEVEYSTDQSNWTVIEELTPQSDVSFTIEGLTNGILYYIRAFQVNANGRSPASNVRSYTPEVPATVPGAPTLELVEVLDKAVKLVLTANADDGGSAITGYAVEVSGEGLNNVWFIAPGLSITPGEEFVVDTNINDSLFYFRAYATNSIGESSRSEIVEATPTAPATQPEAPSVQAQTDFDTITIDITPNGDGGSEITGYKIEEKIGDAPYVDSGLTTNALSVVKPLNTTITWYRVIAVNEVGESDPSIVLGGFIRKTVPDQPTLTGTLNQDGDAVSIQIDPPAFDGNAEITSHKLYVHTSLMSEGTWHFLRSFVGSGSVSDILPLSSDYASTFKAVAANAVGDSLDSGEIGPYQIQPVGTVPSTIRVLGVNSLTVTGSAEPEVWVAYQQPTSVGSDVTQYEVSLYQYEEKEDWTLAPITGDAVVTQTFPVENGQAPSIQIPVAGREGEVLVAIMRAENSTGWSQPSVGYLYGEDGVHSDGDLPAKVEVGRLILTSVIENVDLNSSEGSVTIQWKEADVLFDHSHEETTVTERYYEVFRNLDGSFEALYFPLTLAPSEVFPGGGQNPTITTEFTDLADGHYYFRFLTANAYMAENQNVLDWQKSEHTQVLHVQRAVPVQVEPDPPTISGVVEDGGNFDYSVRLTITPPEYTGDSPISYYKLFTWDSAEERWEWWRNLSDTSHLVQNPIAGNDPIDNIYAVKAFNESSRQSGFSNQIGPFTPPVVETPPTPILEGLEVGFNQITVSFSSGGDHSVDIARYEIRWQKADGTASIFDAGLTSPFTLSGLNGGEQYTITVRAVDSNGAESGWTSPDFATPESDPTERADWAISDLVAENWSRPGFEGEGWATLNFTPITDQGGIVDIRYEFTVDGGINWSEPDVGDLPPYIVSLGSQGTYQIQVRGYTPDRSQVSPASNIQELTTSYVIGDSLDWVKSFEVDGSVSPDFIRVSFDSVNRSSWHIERYDFFVSLVNTWGPVSNFTALPDLSTNDAETVSFDLSLPAGEAYTVSLRAVDVFGNISPSVSDTDTLLGVPTAPKITSVDGGSRLITVNFTDGSSMGGTVVATEYQLKTSDQATWPDEWNELDRAPIIEGSADSFALTAHSHGVSYGVTYNVRMRHVLNPDSFSFRVDGEISDIGTGTPTVEAPSVPTITDMSWDNGVATMNWITPTDGGVLLSDYQYSINGGVSWTAIANSVSMNQFTFGQEPNITVEYSLRAVNVEGLISEVSTFTLESETVDVTDFYLSFHGHAVFDAAEVNLESHHVHLDFVWSGLESPEYSRLYRLNLDPNDPESLITDPSLGWLKSVTVGPVGGAGADTPSGNGALIEFSSPDDEGGVEASVVFLAGTTLGTVIKNMEAQLKVWGQQPDGPTYSHTLSVICTMGTDIGNLTTYNISAGDEIPAELDLRMVGPWKTNATPEQRQIIEFNQGASAAVVGDIRENPDSQNADPPDGYRTSIGTRTETR